MRVGIDIQGTLNLAQDFGLVQLKRQIGLTTPRIGVCCDLASKAPGVPTDLTQYRTVMLDAGLKPLFVLNFVDAGQISTDGGVFAMAQMAAKCATLFPGCAVEIGNEMDAIGVCPEMVAGFTNRVIGDTLEQLAAQKILPPEFVVGALSWPDAPRVDHLVKAGILYYKPKALAVHFGPAHLAAWPDAGRKIKGTIGDSELWITEVDTEESANRPADLANCTSALVSSGLVGMIGYYKYTVGGIGQESVRNIGNPDGSVKSAEIAAIAGALQIVG